MPFPLLLLLLADPAAVNGKLIVETRAGESPVTAGQASQAYASTLVIPQVELRLRDPRAELRLAYLPQFVWQFPAVNGNLEARPLILHRAALSLVGRPTATTNVVAIGAAAVGQPDYYSLPQLIGPGQAYVPRVDKIFTASGSLVFSEDLTFRWRLLLSAGLSTYRPYGNIPPPDPMQPFALGTAGETTVGGAVGARHLLTPIDDVSGIVSVSDADYTTGADLLLISPRLIWMRRQPAGDDFRLTVGLSYARDHGSMLVLAGGPALLPTGSLAVTRHLIRSEGYVLSMGINSTVEQYVDPVLRVSGPRAQVGGQVLFTIVPSWIIGVDGQLFLGLRRTPLAGDPDETTFTVNVPVRRRLSKNATLELGGRWSERGPAVSSPTFGFRERQLLAYLQLMLTTEDIMPYGSR